MAGLTQDVGARQGQGAGVQRAVRRTPKRAIAVGLIDDMVAPDGGYGRAAWAAVRRRTSVRDGAAKAGIDDVFRTDSGDGWPTRTPSASGVFAAN